MGVYQKSLVLLAISLVLLQDLGHCQQLACTGNNTQNVHSFTINATSPIGNINLMYVQFDATRMIPLSTTALHNSLNIQQNVDRLDDFRRHPCPNILGNQTACQASYRMTLEQTSISGGSKTSYDRGHLTPANPNRFSTEAVSDTFYCVNIAPQDPFTNQNPWFTVEDKSHKYFTTTKGGYVMTGLCDADDRHSPTKDGYKIPACFWKLICYVDTSGATQVVGFIGNNTLLNDNDSVGKAKRTADTTTPLGQSDIRAVMTRDTFISAAWDGAEAYLKRNRRATNLPTAENCKAKRTIPVAVKDEWSSLMRESVLEHEFTENVDLELVKEFWKTN